MAKRPCARPGCPNLVDRAYCSSCAPIHSARARSEKKRESAAKRGYGRRWQKTSAGFLKAHPLCADPYGEHGNRPVPANVTDHIQPHKGDMTLFWDHSNWQALCHSCHNRKTVTEDGGFGRAVTNSFVCNL